MGENCATACSRQLGYARATCQSGCRPTPHAPLGETSSQTQTGSHPSECATGLTSVTRYDPWYYDLPGDLERQAATFVEHYNHARYHESLGNLTPADVYFSRAETILLERERIKRQTIANRRLQHQLRAA
jgi:hypothetical protein